MSDDFHIIKVGVYFDRGSFSGRVGVPSYSRMLTAGLQSERAKCVCMVIVSDKIGGNVPFALMWGPRGRRPPTA